MQILLSSGPRYRESWGFYDKVCDRRGTLLVDKFGKVVMRLPGLRNFEL